MKASKRTPLLIVVAYLFANLIIYFVNPYTSPWHYEDHEPTAIVVSQPGDESLSLREIENILEEIDQAYPPEGAQRPKNLKSYIGMSVQIVFLPSTIALIAKSFMGYMGPANQAQQAFTLSVKKRYNHLVQLAVAKGSQKHGFLFLEEPSLAKKNGPPY